jgi:hypothetical protein
VRGRSHAVLYRTVTVDSISEATITSFLVFSAMGGVMRAILEAGAPPRGVRLLRKQLVLLCRGFLMSVATQA